MLSTDVMEYSPAMNDLKSEIRGMLVDGRLPCARAFALAKERGVDPMVVGQAATEESIKISRCQLGLFGYPEGQNPTDKNKDRVTDELKEEVSSHLADGQLPCAVAWQIASEKKIPKMVVAAAANALGVKIRSCQLGCFK